MKAIFFNSNLGYRVGGLVSEHLAKPLVSILLVLDMSMNRKDSKQCKQ